MLSDSRLHKQINFYYCFACLLSSYLIDSLITGWHCITVALWGIIKEGCLEMRDSSLQCRFFSLFLFFFSFVFFTNLTGLFSHLCCITFMSICNVKCERMNVPLTWIPSWSHDCSNTLFDCRLPSCWWVWPMFHGDPVAGSGSGMGVPWNSIFLIGCIFRIFHLWLCFVRVPCW